MEEFDLNLDKAKFPNVVRLYGTNPVDLARDMDRAQSLGAKDREPTRTDLISCMINLEDDLEHERLMRTYDIAEEFPEDALQIRLERIADEWGYPYPEEIGAFKGGVLYGFTVLLSDWNPFAPSYVLAMGTDVTPIYVTDEIYQEAQEFASKCMAEKEEAEEEDEEEYEEEWDEQLWVDEEAQDDRKDEPVF